MKKALLFALAGLLAAVAPALAHPPALPANVNFTSERGVPFGLVLDGRPLTRGVARQVHVDQLLPGAHWAEFTLPTPYGGAVRFRSRVWLQPGLETSFVLVARPGWPINLQQVNAVPLYGPGYGGRGYYNSNGDGRYNSPAGYDPAPYGQGGNYGSPNGYGSNDPYNNGNDDYDNDNNASAPNGGYGNNPNLPNGGYNNAPTPNTGPAYGTPNNPNGSYGNNPNNPNGGYRNGPTPGSYPSTAVSSYRQLAPPDVDALVKTVQGRIAEASKLSAAKDGLSQRSLRADDLGRLVRSISSEACRIDLATFAYSRVSDPENFSRVYDAFETESGARAVEQAVRSASQR